MSDTVKQRTWAEMRVWQEELLARVDGSDLATWNARVAQLAPADEAELRAWLSAQGVHGYAQMLLVMERFGYPEFLTATAEQLLDGQYADRPALRPIGDRLIALGAACGDVTVQIRKTYVSLVTPRRTFANVCPTTKKRVDLGLRLDDVEPGGRLLPARTMANGSFNVRFGLSSLDEVDDEVVTWLQRAYAANV